MNCHKWYSIVPLRSTAKSNENHAFTIIVKCHGILSFGMLERHLHKEIGVCCREGVGARHTLKALFNNLEPRVMGLVVQADRRLWQSQPPTVQNRGLVGRWIHNLRDCACKLFSSFTQEEERWINSFDSLRLVLLWWAQCLFSPGWGTQSSGSHTPSSKFTSLTRTATQSSTLIMGSSITHPNRY